MSGDVAAPQRCAPHVLRYSCRPSSKRASMFVLSRKRVSSARAEQFSSSPLLRFRERTLRLCTGGFGTIGSSVVLSASPGPGKCVVSAYQESPGDLSIGSEGIQDTKGDLHASSSNTFEFTVNATDCLAAAPYGGMSWQHYGAPSARSSVPRSKCG